MPFPRTWSEELISEWLTLDGYFVETNLRVHGRNEVDILGVRVKDHIPEVFHVETGNLSKNSIDVKDMIDAKFSEEIQDSVKKYVKDRLGHEEKNIKYNKLYVAVWASEATMNYLEKKCSVKVCYLEDLINNDIKNTIKKYKANPPHKPKTRGKTLTIPQNLWLLYLVDYLKP